MIKRSHLAWAISIVTVGVIAAAVVAGHSIKATPLPSDEVLLRFLGAPVYIGQPKTSPKTIPDGAIQCAEILSGVTDPREPLPANPEQYEPVCRKDIAERLAMPERNPGGVLTVDLFENRELSGRLIAIRDAVKAKVDADRKAERDKLMAEVHEQARFLDAHLDGWLAEAADLCAEREALHATDWVPPDLCDPEKIAWLKQERARAVEEMQKNIYSSQVTSLTSKDPFGIQMYLGLLRDNVDALRRKSQQP